VIEPSGHQIYPVFSDFKRSLEDDVRKDTSGHFQHILISLLQGNRSEDQELDDQKVKKDAKDLYEVQFTVRPS
jgi:annexin A7/11